MLKPIAQCRSESDRKVLIRKVGNLREAEINDDFIILRDGNRERLMKDVDRFIKSTIETEKADVKIERKSRKDSRR